MRPARRITLKEAAERLGVHYMTAYRYVRTGRLPALLDGGQWSIDESDLRLVERVGYASTRRRPARAERPARLVNRMVAGDEAGAWTVVEGALASGSSPADVYVELLVPALQAIGDGWESGELSVADEHRASAVAVRIVGRLGPLFARRGRSRGTVVLGAPPGEEHGLPCAILADLLRTSGFDALDLGANTPAQSFADTVRTADRLVAVMIGATTLLAGLCGAQGGPDTATGRDRRPGPRRWPRRHRRGPRPEAGSRRVVRARRRQRHRFGGGRR